MTTYYYRTCLF